VTSLVPAITRLIPPRPRDLGGFSVSRVLPIAGQRMVGPFIFWDHIGPSAFAPGSGIDVRPHPHIGLATVTYLFEGAILHRDSLGSVQRIEPGAVNWMTAGSGIAHSERTDARERERCHRLHGIQSWVALPEAQEEIGPSFRHFPAADLPEMNRDGIHAKVIAGRAFGLESPVPFFAPILYVELKLDEGAQITLPQEAERALFVVAGTALIDGQACEEGHMAVLDPSAFVLRAAKPLHAMLLGGAPPGPRHIWWNFVSSRPDRIEQAKADWREGRFATVPGESEFIPLPEG
jgi:redox-sensitive bicupin YhaK (pirin superfamily)